MTSQAVSPRVGKVSEEVEGGDSVNEGASESNDEEQLALQEFDVDFERDPTSPPPASCTLSFHFRGNSGTTSDTSSLPELVPARRVWTWSEQPTWPLASWGGSGGCGHSCSGPLLLSEHAR